MLYYDIFCSRRLFMFKFERIEAKDKESLGGLLNKFGLSFSDHCFGGLYIWSDTYHTEFAVENDTVIIRGKLDGKRFYQAPVGKNFECAVNFLIENDPGNLRFLSISKEEKQRIEEAFPGKF